MKIVIIRYELGRERSKERRFRRCGSAMLNAGQHFRIATIAHRANFAGWPHNNPHPLTRNEAALAQFYVIKPQQNHGGFKTKA